MADIPMENCFTLLEAALKRAQLGPGHSFIQDNNLRDQHQRCKGSSACAFWIVATVAVLV
jgi:hypothetical protein